MGKGKPQAALLLEKQKKQEAAAADISLTIVAKWKKTSL
jgi:hypothetical protein